MGVPTRQAKRIARDTLQRAKDEVRKGGRAETMYRQGDGDTLLELEAESPSIRERLEAARRHGARDEDIRQWNNLPLLLRVALEQQDEALRFGAFRAAKSEGQSPEQAARTAHKAHAIYTADPRQIPVGEPDAALPWELKLRVNAYRDARIAADDGEFESELRASTSFNAWVREKVASGEI